MIRRLRLEPHPEGGHYREIFRSAHLVRRDSDTRSAVTTIYFLLCRDEISRWHVVASDEIWHHYEGAALEIVTYQPEADRPEIVRLGPEAKASRPVHTVPAGCWQSARTAGEYALVGCTVAPGFEFADFRFVADQPGHEAAFAGPLAAYRALL